MKKIQREFIEEILKSSYGAAYQEIFDASPLFQYLDSKTGAVSGDAKSRRSLANVYSIYALLHFYHQSFHDKKDAYMNFDGFPYMSVFAFMRSQYGGGRLQNHALNSRVNGEFRNKIIYRKEARRLSAHD